MRNPAVTDLDPTATLLSVDGIGAFDLISREAVRLMEETRPSLSCDNSTAPRQYIGGPMTWASRRRYGKARAVNRCGQHRAIVHVSEDLLDSERLFAFMDDVYVRSAPDRVEAIHQSVDREMWDHARIRRHQGKTQLWNRGGVAQEGCDGRPSFRHFCHLSFVVLF